MSRRRTGSSKVILWDLETAHHSSHETKLRALLKRAGIGAHLRSGDLTAVKIHFGERGGTSFISPLWMKPILAFLRKCGARPFLTDTGTLYSGSRDNAVSHALLARDHGFDAALLQAPVIIADGIRGTNEKAIRQRGEHFDTCYLAGEIAAADTMIVASHVTGHRLAGFGGALKNLAMGCASRQGKMRQHCASGPVIREDKCRGCWACLDVCPAEALIRDGDRVRLLPERCTGCGQCLAVCPEGAVRPGWDRGGRDFLEGMGEYAAAALSLFSSPVLHLNFLLDITPGCDCEGHTDPPLCPDLGIAASFDPVALDQASLDLVNEALPSNPGSGEKQSDRLERLHPGTDGGYLLGHAERLGIGSRDYTLVRI